jgi:hypothetical protein
MLPYLKYEPSFSLFPRKNLNLFSEGTKFRKGDVHFSKNLWNVIHAYKGILISHLASNTIELDLERFLEFHFKTSFVIKVRNKKPPESADVIEMSLFQTSSFVNKIISNIQKFSFNKELYLNIL